MSRHSYDSVAFDTWILRISIVGLIGIMIYMLYIHERGPWYLGCADRYGKELLLKAENKPKVDGSIIYIGDDVFVTPEPGMTCRIVTIKQAEKEQLAK